MSRIKKYLIQCTSNEGSFYYEPAFAVEPTVESLQSSIDANGGKVTGFRFTGVKVLRVQRGVESANRI